VAQTTVEEQALKNLATHLNNNPLALVIGYPLRLLTTGTAPALKFYGAVDQSKYQLILPAYMAWEKGPVGSWHYAHQGNTITMTSQTPDTLWVPATAAKGNNSFIKITQQEADNVTTLTLTLDDAVNNQVLGWNNAAGIFESI
jgi:hypothetical protein